MFSMSARSRVREAARRDWVGFRMMTTSMSSSEAPEVSGCRGSASWALATLEACSTARRAARRARSDGLGLACSAEPPVFAVAVQAVPAWDEAATFAGEEARRARRACAWRLPLTGRLVGEGRTPRVPRGSATMRRLGVLLTVSADIRTECTSVQGVCEGLDDVCTPGECAHALPCPAQARSCPTRTHFRQGTDTFDTVPLPPTAACVCVRARRVRAAARVRGGLSREHDRFTHNLPRTLPNRTRTERLHCTHLLDPLIRRSSRWRAIGASGRLVDAADGAVRREVRLLCADTHAQRAHNHTASPHVTDATSWLDEPVSCMP